MGAFPVIAMRGPDEVDLHFDSERARLLRKRFLWLCAVSSAMIFLASIPSLLRAAETSGRELAGALVSFFGGWIVLGMHVAAFVYAWRSSPRTSTFLRLAFWLFVIGAIFDFICARVSVELDVEGWMDTDSMAPARAWLILAPFFMLLGHLVTSLFMPWSLRESLVPGAIALAAMAGIIGIDVGLGRVGSEAWLSLLISSLAILPGALICWWRFSQLRQNVEHRYFSRAYHALRHELSTARRIHESLMPPQREQGPLRLSYVYEPMREIGGDLLFVPPPASCNEGRARLNAVLLDVTGHGIAAALTVNRIVGELERLFAERPDSSPAEIFSALNRYVRLTLSHHTVFATALCLRLDAQRGELEYASGGHPPAFLRRGDGSVEALDSTAPLLGIVEDEAFGAEAMRLPFAPGDALLGYTDGANEARSPEGADLGIAGIRRLFEGISANGSHPAQWPRVILEEIRTHRAGAAEDDTLLMVVTRPR